MSTAPTATKTTPAFTRYQVFMIALLALIQFTVILDFMVMSPLGAMLTHSMHITPSQFGLVVSAYAFSASISGIAAAGFADRFDRKRILLFFYGGFVLGTFLCGIAPSYYFLLIARMVTGIFGGVMFSVTMAIIADIFPLQVRGRVMGFVQMAFASSQVLGIPIGLLLANKFGWHMPFLMIVGLCLIIGAAIIKGMQPMSDHLAERAAAKPMAHLWAAASHPPYIRAFLATIFISMGGFLLLPYMSNFLVNNVGISQEQLPLIYIVAGGMGLFTGPLIGRLSDKTGKYNMFIAGTVLATIMVLVMTHLSITPLWLLIIINTLTYTAVTTRMIPSQALISGVPDFKDRGAFMSINSSVQQMGGGLAATIGGWIIASEPNGKILHYDIIGYVCVAAFILCAGLMYVVHKQVSEKVKATAVPVNETPVLAHE